MNVPVEIRTTAVRLRRWRSADAEPVFRACQDAEIQRWTTVPTPYAETDARDFVTMATRTDTPLFAVSPPEADDVLGSMGLVRVDRQTGRGEVGCWIAPWARRQRFGVAAGQALARWAFDEQGLARLEWITDVANSASLRLAERIGFVVVGTMRDYQLNRDGTRSDAVLAALLPDDLPDGVRVEVTR